MVSEQGLRPRRLYPLIAMVLAAGLALVLTRGLVFNEGVQRQWQSNADTLAIATRGMQADGAQVLSWWHGDWIEQNGFYRPLSSMLMWAEARLWGLEFLPYTVVSWLMHALNSALLCLLLYSVTPGPRWQRALAGVVAALLFNLGEHPSGPYWNKARVAWGVMVWWPVQTDFGSLGASLLSLTLLDRYLLGKGRRLLPGALAAYLGALLFKETPLALVLVAPMLGLYREGGLTWRSEEPGRRFPAWLRVTGCYAAIAVAFMALRMVFVPNASNPEWAGTYSFYKLLNWVHLLSAELLHNGETWEWLAIVTMVPLVWAMRRLRVPVLYMVLALVVWPLLVGGLITGNPAIATIPREMTILARFAAVYGGFVLALLLWPREPALIFIVGLFAVATANINRIGPHYWYWPVALWGLVDGAMFNLVVSSMRRRRAVAGSLSTPDDALTPRN